MTLIGFLATWWTGIFIGLGVGLTGLIFNDHKSMRNAITKAIFLVMLVTVITGILGFLYGKFVLANERLDLWHPDNPVDKEAFIIVGSIHNFSYLGGLIGLVSGII